MPKIILPKFVLPQCSMVAQWKSLSFWGYDMAISMRQYHHSKKSGTDLRSEHWERRNERTGSCCDGIKKERNDVKIQQDN